MANIDVYLDWHLDSVEKACPTNPIVYFLLETVEGFDFSTIPDLKTFGHLGRIYTASGTRTTIEALRRHPQVIRVEASR